MTNEKKQKALSFDGLGIAPKLLGHLTDLGFKTPTPIQAQSIPVSLKGKDMVGIAQTGTGKTLAFGVPMLQQLATNKGMGLVVLPTRELALQVDENLKTIGKKIGLRTAVLIGGENINRQLKILKQKPHIIVATPGRLVDHTQRGSVKLGGVKVLVLDEADMMLDMGFLPQIKDILKLLPKERQTMLFSATMPSQIIEIAAKYMKLPTRIEVAPAGSSSKNVEQEIIIVEKEKKLFQLKNTLKETKGSVLVFGRTKHGVKIITKKLNLAGFTADEIHSNRSQNQRRKALDGFKSGRFRILVATDIAARGIDVKNIELVINYDLPVLTSDYVHRIGRTGRADSKGRAVSFVLPDQLKDVRDIEKLIDKNLKINKEASGDHVLRISTEKKGPNGRGRGNFGRGGNRGRKPRNFNDRSSSSDSRKNKKPYSKNSNSKLTRPSEKVKRHNNGKPARGVRKFHGSKK